MCGKQIAFVALGHFIQGTWASLDCGTHGGCLKPIPCSYRRMTVYDTLTEFEQPTFVRISNLLYTPLPNPPPSPPSLLFTTVSAHAFLFRVPAFIHPAQVRAFPRPSQLYGGRCPSLALASGHAFHSSPFASQHPSGPRRQNSPITASSSCLRFLFKISPCLSFWLLTKKCSVIVNSDICMSPFIQNERAMTVKTLKPPQQNHFEVHQRWGGLFSNLTFPCFY